MKPQITKQAIVNVKGIEIKVLGETYEQPIKDKSNSEHGSVYSCVKLLNEFGGEIYANYFKEPMGESELEHEVDYVAKKVVEKPHIYDIKL